VRIAILVTCHNRVEVTVSGLASLADALGAEAGLESTFVIVDDGSNDGTGAEIRRRFPEMVVTTGDGTLFWNGGMCRAFAVAQPLGPFDAYLLFNDDVQIDRLAVPSFLAEYRALNVDRPAILVGATQDANGKLSYSGMKRLSKSRPLAVGMVEPSGAPRVCDTFNGNFVLVPASVFESLGGLDPKFRHAYGDVDLGYRARRSGVPVWLAGRPIGICEKPPAVPLPATRRERRLQRLRARWLKGDSLRQRVHFTLRHAPAPMAIGLIAGATTMRVLLKFAERGLVPRLFDKHSDERSVPEA
jgi:GT2 family glycosyltransferase